MTARTFFTSDLHFRHRLVAGKRGFCYFTGGDISEPDTDAHDAHLISAWNRAVRPEDTVWVLGDITVGWGFDEVRPLVWRLNGVKHLVLGNHDEAHPMHRGAHNKLALYHGSFATVQTMATVRMEGQQVMLSHFPYDGDGAGKPDRCNAYRLRDEGHPLIHGHTHLPGQVSVSRKGSTQIHVGLDAWEMKPVPESIIMRYLRTGEKIGDKIKRAS